MSVRGFPIVGHPATRGMWPLPYGHNSVRVAIWQEAALPMDSSGVIRMAEIPGGLIVTFTRRRVDLGSSGTPFEFLAPSDWSDSEALHCAFTGYQPQGKEIPGYDDAQ